MKFLELVFLTVAYVLKSMFTSYAGYAFLIFCLIAIRLGNRRYYLKRNCVYDGHSIIINRFLKKSRLGRSTKRFFDEKRLDVPMILLGIGCGIAIAVLFALQFYGTLTPSTMYLDVRVLVTVFMVAMVALIAAMIVTSVYSRRSEKMKKHLFEKII